MCSAYILLNNSCYVDDFLAVGTVYAKAIVFGLIIGTAVGILLVFIRKINS
jgi:adenine/guanine phosphoribosyltransferase-like PRPP-binding protein